MSSKSQPGFIPLFTAADLDKWYSLFADKADDKILALLKAAGENFVKYARGIHTYEDRTGNLRSSIGYVIIQDGEIIFENFAESDKGTEKVKGLAKGGQLAEAIALSYPKGLVLIGVAGMQYAAAVEAKGFDVVTGACQSAEAWMKKAINETFKQAA